MYSVFYVTFSQCLLLDVLLLFVSFHFSLSCRPSFLQHPPRVAPVHGQARRQAPRQESGILHCCCRRRRRPHWREFFIFVCALCFFYPPSFFPYHFLRLCSAFVFFSFLPFFFSPSFLGSTAVFMCPLLLLLLLVCSLYCLLLLLLLSLANTRFLYSATPPPRSFHCFLFCVPLFFSTFVLMFISRFDCCLHSPPPAAAVSC